jgi:flavodoxin
MKVLVVYDSFFGNTEKVASAIGGALQPQHEVTVVRVGEVKPEQINGVELLIVGTPTRGFKASEATLAFLSSLQPGSLKGIRVAAFDTRIDMKKQKSVFVRFIGKFFRYAAEPTAAALVKAGGAQAQPPAGFFVEESEGPLRIGELDRATAWANTLC